KTRENAGERPQPPPPDPSVAPSSPALRCSSRKTAVRWCRPRSRPGLKSTYSTARVTPDCVLDAPIEITMGTAPPDGACEGIRTFTGAPPAPIPGAGPAYSMTAGIPPTVADTSATGFFVPTLSAGVTMPVTLPGVVTPSPVM